MDARLLSTYTKTHLALTGAPEMPVYPARGGSAQIRKPRTMVLESYTGTGLLRVLVIGDGVVTDRDGVSTETTVEVNYSLEKLPGCREYAKAPSWIKEFAIAWGADESIPADDDAEEEQLMADLDKSTGHVRQHLKDSAEQGCYGLHIHTEPGLNGRAVTNVRRSLNMVNPWTERYANHLAEILRELPDAEVELRPVRDKITVTWRGVK